jgi:hypothetical protein
VISLRPNDNYVEMETDRKIISGGIKTAKSSELDDEIKSISVYQKDLQPYKDILATENLDLLESCDSDSSEMKESLIENAMTSDEEFELVPMDGFSESSETKDFSKRRPEKQAIDQGNDDQESLNSEKVSNDKTDKFDLLEEKLNLVNEVFSKELKEQDLDSVKREIEKEIETMEARVIKENILAASIPKEILEDVRKLLEIFGIPYLNSPGEAEAQCAYLEQENFVDGILTDDSDVFLFGGCNIYKVFNILNCRMSFQKNVVHYSIVAILFQNLDYHKIN